METVICPNSRPGRGLTANQLKLIAIIAMLIDHIASLFVPYEAGLGVLMHLVGRITGPVMFFLAAAGYHYTRNVKRYIGRLGVFAAVSYIPFVWAFSGTPIVSLDNFYYFPVIFTILLGVLAIHVRRSALPNGAKFALILGLYMLSWFGDWGTMCLSIMLVFDLFQGDFKKQFWAYIAVIFIQGNLVDVLFYPIQSLIFGEGLDLEILWMYASQFGMILPALLLSRYNGEKGKGGALAKYGFYIFYPLHLTILAILAYVVFA